MNGISGSPSRSAGAPEADVLVVGYGPVGQVLSILLAQHGWRVVVVERHPEPYSLPRAVAFDAEAARTLDAAGVADRIGDITEPSQDYVVSDAAGQQLLRIGLGSPDGPGRPDSTSVYQPGLEAALAARGEELPTLRVHRGLRAVELTGSDSGAELVAEDERSGERRTFTASWVVGCDGAGSFVRRSLGVGWADSGFALDWLACDVVPHRPEDFPPSNLQIADPARPRVAVSCGPGRRRWEFMRMPGEDRAEFGTEENAWRLLSMFSARPDNATLTRHATYTFRARNAEHWRRGRVLLAGDAAHQMPPFAGQGMCSGFRDAANLAWKLDLVLDGRAGEALLDSYELERRAHVQHAIDLSVRLGHLICMTDPTMAADRDRAMTARPSGPARPSEPARSASPLGEHLAEGFLADGGPPAGELIGENRLTGPEGPGPADSVLGPGFVLLCRDNLADTLSPAALETLRLVHGRVVTVLRADAGGAPGPAAVLDTDGRFLPWLESIPAGAVLIRPDRYLFGAAPDADGLAALITDFGRRLRPAAQGPGPAAAGSA
ncbi:bifunctional 3-(3-hydroxy-phenyl)propionate/3-hydroxycinnamic acid hydroxylase MhpA [Streptomyces sp. rh34]|uniref:bifunctional 3-(3-hydroxy-phenyl)propionate/3-hydroxycinnamic acid hydroxylase MhpA n=1 Tax=Streptomyces sp. rh34 TaxID=2034272 RepID=UPI000BF0B169|nr:bifunctional 3-(3-hydroxy-phenyl)propionate/3-hydroxycinnamic acid hydroxylase [Streptomyces sp. rh34]